MPGTVARILLLMCEEEDRGPDQGVPAGSGRGARREWGQGRGEGERRWLGRLGCGPSEVGGRKGVGLLPWAGRKQAEVGKRRSSGLQPR